MTEKPYFIAIVKRLDKDAEREEVRRRFMEEMGVQNAERVEIKYDRTNDYGNICVNIYKCRIKEEGQQ